MTRRKGNHFYVTGLQKPLKWTSQTRNAIWEDLRPVIRRQRQDQGLTKVADNVWDDAGDNLDRGWVDEDLFEDFNASAINPGAGAIRASDTSDGPPIPLFPVRLSRRNEENRKRRDDNWARVREPFLEAIMNGQKARCRTTNCETTSHIIWLISLTAPLKPKLAFSLDLIRFFHQIIMIGNVSKYAWAHGLHRFLQKTMRQRLPEFKKPWEYAYFNWLELDRICQSSCMKDLERLSGNTFKQNALASLCPACFHRPDKDDSPYIFSIDGNFQHSRRKWISAGRESSSYTRELFIPDDSAQVNLDGQNLENTGGCNHTFVAASMESKPKSMTSLDETGIMGAVCRHDIPLRYLNLFTGERSSSSISLIKSIVDQCPVNTSIHVQYDIACKLQRSLQLADPILHQRVQLSLNAFHNYAHELRCQLRWGPLRTEGLGRSDGEGCERNWASMAHLVSVGRQSSAKSRMMLLDQHGLHQAGRLRTNLVFTLQRRIEKCEQDLRISSQALDDLVSLSKEQGGTVTRAFVEMELRREAEAQRSWFMANSEAYDNYVSCYQFKEAFQHIKREKELEAELYETLNRSTLVRPESTERWKRVIAILEDQCAQAVCATDEVLRRFNQCRADWIIDGHLWTTYSSLETWLHLEKLKLGIHRQISSRVIELKSIRSRIRGHKGAQKLVQSLKKRLPKIGGKVDEYNKLCATLPEHCRPPNINKDTFDVETLERNGNLPLWEFESCRASLLGNNRTWKYSTGMIQGVEALYRQARAMEELFYLRKELGRTLDWLESQLSSLLSALPYLNNSDFRSRGLEMVMDLLETCKEAIASDGDVFYGRSLATLRKLVTHALQLLPRPAQIDELDPNYEEEDLYEGHQPEFIDDNDSQIENVLTAAEELQSLRVTVENEFAFSV